MLENRQSLPIRAGGLAGLILLSGCVTTGRSPTDQVAYGCGEPKPRVAVAGFSVRDDDVPEGVAQGLTDSLMAALAATGCYRMIDGAVADAAGGRRARADLVVAGTVTEFAPDASTTAAGADQLPEWLGGGALRIATSRIDLSLRLVDARTGEVLAASTASGTSSQLGGELTEEEHGYAFAHSTEGGIDEAMHGAVAEAVGFLVRQTHGPQVAAAT